MLWKQSQLKHGVCFHAPTLAYTAGQLEGTARLNTACLLGFLNFMHVRCASVCRANRASIRKRT